ncbi:major facilitator superfamily permease [Klebsiella pneumoniae]|nr:major facilitator superfamily permease [Klebsiella pneumoniae]
MVTALLLAASCSLLSTMMTSWHGILIMRALIGLSLSGVAAVGMTYLSEEIHPSFVAFSMGLYISGNSIGGMSGRLLTGVFTDFFGWRVALAAISGFCAGRGDYVLAYPSRVAPFPPDLAATENAAD